MREIKFRGKSNNGNWVYGYPIIVSYKAWIKDISDKTTNPRRLSRDFADFRCVEVEKETIGQYTGLKDKNSKEIYEGDIVIMKDEPEDIGSVVWDSHDMDWVISMATAELKMGGYWSYELEVIGNIYENSEILDGDK